MKTDFITISRLFPKGHRKEGGKTFFKEQLQNALLADAGVSACDCCRYETRDCGACGHEASGFHKIAINNVVFKRNKLKETINKK